MITDESLIDIECVLTRILSEKKYEHILSKIIEQQNHWLKLSQFIKCDSGSDFSILEGLPSDIKVICLESPTNNLNYRFLLFFIEEVNWSFSAEYNFSRLKA